MEELIQKYKNEITQKKGITNTDIDTVEKSLGLTIHDSLKKYLLQYGALSFRSMELTGLGYSSTSYRNIIKATKEARENASIPKDAVVIEDVGEFHYIICKADGSVYYWGNGQEIEKVANVISDYIEKRIQEEL